MRTILFFMFVFASSAWSDCLGPKNFEIEMVQDGENIVIKRVIDGKGQDEILDDSGYLSAQLTLTRLLMSTDKDVYPEKYREELQFLRIQLKRFLSALVAADQGGIMVKTLGAGADLQAYLAQCPCSKDTLRAKWTAFEAELVKVAQLRNTVSIRQAGDKNWQSDVDVAKVTAPIYQPTGQGSALVCAQTISVFHFPGFRALPEPIPSDQLKPRIWKPKPDKRKKGSGGTVT